MTLSPDGRRLAAAIAFMDFSTGTPDRPVAAEIYIWDAASEAAEDGR